ncbi:MAG TPA: TldD/PmbA family protein [Bdellovibrionales bacterium]|nr:TldD/PmbA family protein [Bdellovibrionales bacterium]
MLSQNLVRKVLDCALGNGADFAEIFVEESYSSELGMIDSKPSIALVGKMHGAGIRLFYGIEQIYVTTNDLSEAGLMKAAKTAAAAKKGTSQSHVGDFKPTDFDELHSYGVRPNEYDRDRKLSWLTALDRAARDRSSMVVQVEPKLIEKHQRILVANSLGIWAEDERCNVRAFVSTLLEDKGNKQSSHEVSGTLGTTEYFESIDFKDLAHSAVDRAKLLIHADYAPAGEMPVIIDNGFGGVIFHEACGHGLETTSVAKGASVFCEKLDQKIAHDCVTAVDDGTIKNTWGSLNVDDEGMKTEKTVLIENGVLKSYIVDQMGAKQTGYARTGSGRRQNYKFAPASRMRNTYIAAGKDKLEDMIRDVDYGLYAKKMGGGSVSPGTGDYNFGVQEGYIIRNGKIEKPVKGATLIGRGIETLGRITKVGNELTLETGMCGSVSGSIPTTVGQPAITVSKILVGGRAS